MIKYENYLSTLNLKSERRLSLRVSNIPVELTNCNQWFGLQIPVGVHISSQTPKCFFPDNWSQVYESHLKLDNGLTVYKNASKKNID